MRPGTAALLPAMLCVITDPSGCSLLQDVLPLFLRCTRVRTDSLQGLLQLNAVTPLCLFMCCASASLLLLVAGWIAECGLSCQVGLPE